MDFFSRPAPSFPRGGPYPHAFLFFNESFLLHWTIPPGSYLQTTVEGFSCCCFGFCFVLVLVVMVKSFVLKCFQTRASSLWSL